MTLINNNPEVNKRIDELVRNNYGTIMSTLTMRLGTENIIQIDNLVARSFSEAKTDWSYREVPADPNNKIWQLITDNSSDLFCVKIQNRSSDKENGEHHTFNLNYPDRDEAVENNVTMLFTCCHSDINPETRVSLILKILGGYTSSEIARAQSKNEVAVIDQIHEAKVNLLSGDVPFEIPEESNLTERLNNVLDSLFAIFELGFSHPYDKSMVFPELCHTAISLLKYLILHQRTNTPKVSALLAYMYLCGSRLNSMIDRKGNLLNLKEQDRSLWDSKMISRGIDYLYSSANGKEVSDYHLKAGVAAIHSTSIDYESTNWRQIISLYDNYLELNYSPFAELEKAIAVSRAHGPEESLNCLRNIKQKSEIEDTSLYSLTLGNLNLQLHNYSEALHYLSRALKLSENSYENIYINNKIHICEQRIKMTERYRYGLSF